MPNQHRIECGRATRTAVTNNGAHRALPARAPGDSWEGRPCEKLKEEPGPESKPMMKRVTRLDWEMVALWLFIAGIILVSSFAGYQLWTKLSFHSP